MYALLHERKGALQCNLEHELGKLLSSWILPTRLLKPLKQSFINVANRVHQFCDIICLYLVCAMLTFYFFMKNFLQKLHMHNAVFGKCLFNVK